MATRKKRSPSRKLSKKSKKATKRQFLAGLPQSRQLAGFLPFGPGAGLPTFPTIPSPQMAFGSTAGAAAFPAKLPQPGLPALKMGSFPGENIPGIAPFSAFPSLPSSPFVKEPQMQNMNFFSNTAGSQWSPRPTLRGGMGGIVIVFLFLQSIMILPVGRPFLKKKNVNCGSHRFIAVNSKRIL